MSNITFTHKLPTTSLSEAIVDPVYRAVHGLDTNDVALFRSAFVDGPDAVFEIFGQEQKGIDTIVSQTFNGIGPLVTTHYISNIRVNVADETAREAEVTAYAQAVHYREGEGMNFTDEHRKKLVSGSMYALNMVKQPDGTWKMARWSMKIVWAEGDMSVVGH